MHLAILCTSDGRVVLPSQARHDFDFSVLEERLMPLGAAKLTALGQREADDRLCVLHTSVVQLHASFRLA